MRSLGLQDAVARIENDERLDRLIESYEPISDWLSQGPRGWFLRGEWLGHALHPMLTDFPIGCWTSAALLDVIGGPRGRVAARRLIAIGLLLVPITAAAGSADFATITDARTKRVAIVHAVGNGAVAAMYWKSWRARARGRQLRGVAWGMAGGTFATAVAYLGGHLAFGRGVGQGVRGVDDADLLDRDNAADLLDVTPDRVDAMVDEGLLDAVSPGRYRRTDVLAARLNGG